MSMVQTSPEGMDNLRPGLRRTACRRRNPGKPYPPHTQHPEGVRQWAGKPDSCSMTPSLDGNGSLTPFAHVAASELF